MTRASWGSSTRRSRIIVRVGPGQALPASLKAYQKGNRLNVIDFAGIFSGTALGAPRSVAVRLQAEY